MHQYKFWDTAHRTKNDNYALLMVPKGRRWRLNSGGRKALHKGKQGFQVSKQASKKLWYLLAFSPHCPYHKHLEVIKVKVNKLWSICLTKYKLAISSPLNTRAAPHATQLRSHISSCHSKYMCIIENRQWGTPCTWYRSYPIIKITRQADNEHLSNLLIYHGNMVLFYLFSSFLICLFFSNTFFIRRMLHRFHNGDASSFHY